MKYISYIRVSTDKQGVSGLGMEAQRTSILKAIGAEPMCEYIEVESGKKANRQELTKALEHCKREGAVLVVAKLDRLSRSVSFLFNLRESGVNFKCLDIPELTTLTLGMFATFAQYEREKISERTKLALAEKKKQGVKLGNPYLKYTGGSRSAETQNKKLIPYIKSLKKNGLSNRDIANCLNSEGHLTTSGKLFQNGTIDYLLKK